jgi:hypothetical protein
MRIGGGKNDMKRKKTEIGLIYTHGWSGAEWE